MTPATPAAAADVQTRLAAVERRRRALLEERRQILCELHRSGMTVRDIGRAIGLTGARVHRIIGKNTTPLEET